MKKDNASKRQSFVVFQFKIPKMLDPFIQTTGALHGMSGIIPQAPGGSP